MERVRVFGKPSGGADHPLLAQRTFVRRQLFAAAEQNAKWRYNGYQRLAKMEY